jgi:hypothetical protein
MRLIGDRSRCNLAKCGSEIIVFQILHTHLQTRRDFMGSGSKMLAVRRDGRLSNQNKSKVHDFLPFQLPLYQNGCD